MNKIVYTDPETFETTEKEFSDYHYYLARRIRDYVMDKFDYWNEAQITQPTTDKDGKSIMFGVIRNRQQGNTIAEKYKITIEKISDEK